MFNVYVGWDAREKIAYDVCKSSIERRASIPVNVVPLKHRELRGKGLFTRPWLMEATTGLWRDLVDDKNFSTEFSHTRFLVPALNNYKGWALFMDCDMIFTHDIKDLISRIDNKYAVMVVKHRQNAIEGTIKMDGQKQSNYHRKNWSSFVLWNCEHPLNKDLTPHVVSSMPGSFLHAFTWIPENLIGHIGFDYNWIENCSPFDKNNKPKVIHYTLGGPWFEEDEWKDVMFADLWYKEYDHYKMNNPDEIDDIRRSVDANN